MAKQKTSRNTAEYDFSEQVGYLLRRANQRHVAIFQNHLPAATVTVPQFAVLCALKNDEKSSINDLVKSTVIDQATIRGVIERLQARELITVLNDESDKRKVQVSLTREGLALVSSMEATALQISEETYGTLNAAERIALVMLLKKMCESDDVTGSFRKR